MKKLEKVLMEHPWQNPSAIAHVQLLQDSFRHWFGQELLSLGLNRAGCADSVQSHSVPSDSVQPDSVLADPVQAAAALYYAPFALLSHGCQVDPILNYGNQTALVLWDRSWDDFTTMPSRLTAEPEVREGRSQLLAQAKQQGYLTDYEGVRISKTGQRFLIRKAMIWQVFDAAGQIQGQAAAFQDWQRL